MADKSGSSLIAVRHNISHGTIPEQDLRSCINEDSQKPHTVSRTATKLLFSMQYHLLQSLYPTAVKTNMGRLSYLGHTTILTWLTHVSLFSAPFSSVIITLLHMVVSQHTEWEPKGRIKGKFTHIWEEKIFKVLQFLHLCVPVHSIGSVIWSLFYKHKVLWKVLKKRKYIWLQQNAMLVA